MSALELERVSVRLGGREVLSGIDLTVARGEVVGVVGPNGAGKTTLLRAALGLIPLSGGQVRLGHDNLSALSAVARAGRAAYMPQSREIGWNMPTVRIASLGAPQTPPQDALGRARRALAAVGLAGFEDRGVLDLSGGERARVLLARLLVSGAPLLAADEPAAGLDPEAQLLAMALLRKAAQDGAGVIVTLHDLTLAARSCDRLLVLRNGRVATLGPPAVALSTDVLCETFGLDGGLVETSHGLVLTARRQGDG